MYELWGSEKSVQVSLRLGYIKSPYSFRIYIVGVVKQLNERPIGINAPPRANGPKKIIFSTLALRVAEKTTHIS